MFGKTKVRSAAAGLCKFLMEREKLPRFIKIRDDDNVQIELVG